MIPVSHALVLLTKITPHPRNVRRGDVDAIVSSLQVHGQYRSIVVQRSTNFILAGNHTYKAALQLGWKDIRVEWIDVDDDEALRILLIDNRSNDVAGYDDAALSALLEELRDSDRALEGTGYTPDDLDELLKSVTGSAETLTDPDEVPSEVVTRTKTGDIWVLGGGRPTSLRGCHERRRRQPAHGRREGRPRVD